MSASPTVPPAKKGSGRKRELSRRTFAGGVAAVVGATMLDGLASSASTAASPPGPPPDDFGSVSTAPQLPAGFTKTFKGRFVKANGIRQHVVIGGDGPPLLLVHGWPQNWYAWRFMMPALARDYTVIAPDQRGIGLSERAQSGYDAATLAVDLAALGPLRGRGAQARGERRADCGHPWGRPLGRRDST